MAIIRAAANGNFSATATWVGGVVPTAADDAVSNNFIVVVDTNHQNVKFSRYFTPEFA